MPIYRVIAAVNAAPGHYDGYSAGDPLAYVTARPGAVGPVLFAIDAADVPAVLDEMWVLGNRVRDDVQGRRWPTDVRSLSTGDVLIVYPPGYPRAAERVETFAVTPAGFDRIPAPRPGAWVPLDGSSATSRPTAPPIPPRRPVAPPPGPAITREAL